MNIAFSIFLFTLVMLGLPLHEALAQGDRASAVVKSADYESPKPSGADICTAQGLKERVAAIEERRREEQRKARPPFKPSVNLSAVTASPPPKMPNRDWKDQELDGTLALAQALDAIPSSLMSDRFKMALVQSPQNLKQLLNGKATYGDRIFLPWPANDNDAKNFPVKAGELQEFTKKLSPAQVQNLKAVLANIPGMGDYAIPSRDTLPEKPDTSLSETESLQIAEEARRSILEAISGGAPVLSLTRGQLAMRDKISSLHFSKNCKSTLDFSSGEIPLCFERGKNADALVGKLISNLASQVDDCHLETASFKVNQAAVEAFLKTTPIKNPNDRYMIMSCLKGHSTTTEDCIGDGSPEIARQIENAKLVEVGVPALADQDLPFQEARLCLAEKAAMRTLSDSDFNKYADQVIRTRKTQFGSGYDSSKDRKKLLNAFRSRPACFKTNKSSQENKTMSMWLASRAAAVHLNSYLNPTSDQALDTISSMVSSATMFEWTSVSDAKKKQTPAEVIMHAQMDISSAASSDALPSGSMLEKVILSQPGLRKSLACGVKSAKPVCESISRMSPSRPAKGIK